MLELKTALELGQWRENHPGHVLLDVLPEGSYLAEHLPGAENACVYETAFAGKVAQLAPDPGMPVAVYGVGAKSREAVEAAEKLARLGYTQVAVYRGGLEDWRAGGLQVEGPGWEAAGQGASAERLKVDAEKSLVRWTGRNLANQHYGTLRLKRGEVGFDRAGNLKSGNFVVDMQTLTVEDLREESLARMLVQHLQDADFFLVAQYPEATFEVSGAEAVTGATPGSPNLRVSGDLTIRGVCHPLVFCAEAGWRQEGGWAAQARIEFDRTRWGARYGSGRFFERLGQHLVNDLVALDIRILAG